MTLPISNGEGRGGEGRGWRSGTMRDNGAIHSLGEQWVRSAKELHVYICQVGRQGPRCQEERRTLSVSSLYETFLLSPSLPPRPLRARGPIVGIVGVCSSWMRPVCASWKGAMGGPTCCPWEPTETRVPHQTPPWLRARLTESSTAASSFSPSSSFILRATILFPPSYSSIHFSRRQDLTGVLIDFMVLWRAPRPRKKNRYDDIMSRQVYLELITRESKSRPTIILLRKLSRPRGFTQIDLQRNIFRGLSRLLFIVF